MLRRDRTSEESAVALLQIIDRFLAGDVELADFKRDWTYEYIEVVPDDFPDEQFDDFFWRVHDKVELTSVEAPIDSDRALGRLSLTDFIGWLKRERERFRAEFDK